MSFFSNANISADLVTGLDKAYPDVVLRKHVLLGLCEHDNRGGASVTVPISTGYTVGEGTSLATAINANSNTPRQAFVVTPYTDYRSGDVNIAQAMWSDDPNLAAVNILMDESKKTIQGLGDSVERALFSDGYGVLGTIASHSGTTPNFVVTLTKPTDAFRFQVGATLVSKSSGNAASLDPGTCTVAARDPVAGTVNLTSDGTWGVVDSHVLGMSGVMAASTAPVLWPGLAGWNPDINNRPASNDSWFGVNRYPDPTALAGTAIDGTGYGPKQALNTLLQFMSNTSGFDIDTCLMNPADFGKLMDEFANQKEMIEVTGEMGVNYGGVRIVGDSGPINVLPSPFATAGIIRVLDSSVLKVRYPGKKPIELKDDAGIGFTIVPTDDIARFSARANFIFYVTNTAALGNVKIY